MYDQLAVIQLNQHFSQFLKFIFLGLVVMFNLKIQEKASDIL